MDMGNHIAEMHWGNTAATADYLHTTGQCLSLKTSLIYSQYDFIEAMDVLKVKESFDAYLRHRTAREDVTITPSANQKIAIGLQYDHIYLKSG